MSNIEPFILDLMMMMTAAFIVTLLFKKLKQPVVLAYIIAGFLISPNFTLLPTVVSVDDISLWSELGIIFLMFALGLEFSFRKITEVGGSAMITAITVMSCMIATGYAIGGLLGWEKMDALFLGGMLSMSSTMIILKSYEELDKKNESFAQVVMGALVIEDIGGIFMMIILSTIAVSKGGSGGDILSQMGLLLVFLVLWFAVGIYLIPSVIRKTKKLMNDEVLLIASLAICLLMVVIANVIGFSSALGAFMAGSILAGTLSGERIEKIVKPVKDMFGAVFFISVGMLIEPELLIEYIIPIIVISIVTVIGQMTFSTLGILISGHSLKTAVSGGFSMVQIGEFSFILAALGTNLGVTSSFLYPIVVCVSVITAFATPVFIKKSDSIYQWIDEKLPDKAHSFLKKYTSDRKSSMARESEWREYLKIYLIRTLICGGGMLTTYVIGTRWASPVFNEAFGEAAGNIVVLVFMMIMIIGLTAIMHWKKNMIFTRLWLSNTMNRLPLAALQAIRTMISVTIIITTIRYFYELPIIAAILIGIAVVAMVMKSNIMSSAAINVELRFLHNLSEKNLASLKKTREEGNAHKLLDERIHVCEVKVIDKPKHGTVKELYDSRFIDILIIKIVKGDGTVINIPEKSETIEEGDIIHILGKEDAIRSFLMLVDNLNTMTMMGKDYSTLKEYRYSQLFKGVKPENTLLCCSVPVYRSSSFCSKPIRHCGFKKNYKGLIIGVERGNFPVFNPPVDTVISAGDLLWVIGTNEMADKLLLRGILEEERVVKY